MRNIMLHYTSAKKEGFFCMKKFKVRTKLNSKLKYISNLCILHYLHQNSWLSKQTRCSRRRWGGLKVGLLLVFEYIGRKFGHARWETFAKFDTPKEFWVVQNSKAGKNCASEWQRSKLMWFFWHFWSFQRKLYVLLVSYHTMGISASEKRINKKKRYANKCHHCIKFSPRKIYNFD